MLLRVVAAFVLVLGAAACDRDEAAERAAEPRPSPACPNHDLAVSEGDLRRPGSLAGDVTGDGSAEEVTIAFDPEGTEECRAFLVVEAAGETHAVNIEQEGMFDVAPELELPRLKALAAVDERSGAEIIVDLLAGASTEFVGVFSMGGGFLERMRVSDDLPPADDLFAYGGSVGHLDGVDCAADGLVVSSAAAPSGDRYLVERRFLRPGDGTLTYERARDERHLVELEELAERFQEFRLAPFGSCD